MELGEGIRRHGFRKWYERQLLRSHAHLVLTFLCMIGILAAFEAMRGQVTLQDKMFDVLAIALCGGVGVWALRRYLRLLLHAEHLANQAECPTCGTYGRLRCHGQQVVADELEVQCGKCGHTWCIRG